MFAFAAYVFTATISTVAIVIERSSEGLATMVANEARPESLEQADTMLAWNGYGRTGAWDLGPHGTVQAQLQVVDNRFNDVTAARLWARLGTTHDELVAAPAESAMPGDIISDLEMSDVTLVAGQSVEGEHVKIHQVSEGKTWEERYTGQFHRRQSILVARKR